MAKGEGNARITPERIREVVKEVLSEMTAGGAKPAAERRATRQGVGRQTAKSPGEARASEATFAKAKKPTLTVCVAADHGGFALKETLKNYLEQELGVIVKDLGTHSRESVDYPDFALAVGKAVASGECEKGIVVDTMGIGSAIAANKVKGIRAALCHDVATARNSRAHNDANVLALGSNVVNPGHARRIVREWLATPFEGGRHGRRVQKIVDAERD